MFTSSQYKRIKQLGIKSSEVDKQALQIAGNFNMAYECTHKFLKLNRKLKDAGINSTTELDQLLLTLVEMEISNASDLKAYRQRVWDLKAIRGS